MFGEGSRRDKHSLQKEVLVLLENFITEELTSRNLVRSQGFKRGTLPEAGKVSIVQIKYEGSAPAPITSWPISPIQDNLFILGFVLKDSSLDLQK